MRGHGIAAVVCGMLWLAATLCCTAAEPVASRRLPEVAPESIGFDPHRLAQIDVLVDEALEQKKMPGCVVAVGRKGKFVWRKAYGHRSLLPDERPMTVDTLFDLASLTKPIATATSIMILVDHGQLRLRDPVRDVIPDFAVNGKEEITIQDLLTHQSGLLPDNALDDYLHGPDEAWRKIWSLGLQAPPRTQFIYSDVGFETLGEIVRRISGKDVHAFSWEHIFAPLQMMETGFLPASHLRPRSVVTEQREGRWMQGEVHDPRAYLLGGVAGHAGLFSTVDDLALYATMMLGDGEDHGVRVLSPAAWRAMTDAYPVPGDHLRGLGWDKLSSYSSNRGEWFSSHAFGHGGFTGTGIWIDPGLDLFVIFLSNRVHPDGKGSVNPLIGRIGTVAAGAIVEPVVRAASHSSAAETLCGIDVLRRDGFQALDGRTVGLITNHTGLARDGTSTTLLLHQAANVHLKVLFSPEHGFQGKLDTSHIANSQDEQTKLPIYSLYNESRRPDRNSLIGLDTIVFDIQDIGCRFYTYVSTMGNAMQVAAETGLRFVVLDRPNPINGVDVQGPVLDAGRESFVGFHTIPVRHGMTVGELARMFRAEMGLDQLDLQVIPVEGWRRDAYWDATGLTWVNPSPNMRSLTQALLYPGIGLLETTNLSVGRGTDTPFQWIGAPWIDGRELARVLQQAKLPGISFVPVRFTPTSSRFADETCEGVEFIITDRARFQPMDVGLLVATTLRQLYRDTWELDPYMRLLGDQAVFGTVRDARPLEVVQDTFQAERHEFELRRTQFLLY